MNASTTVRPIDAGAAAEIDIVATRMRETLIEVLGEARVARELQSHAWLVDRVEQHLDPARITGQVFVAETAGAGITGHTIVRIDDDGFGNAIGLFGTVFVTPGFRRAGIAGRLLDRGEAWMRARGMTEAVTYTDRGNKRLQDLFIRRGYAMSRMPREFVKLARTLA